MTVDSLDPAIRDLLAVQRLGQLFTSGVHKEWVPHEVQARAALIPVNNPKCRDPWLIKRRSAQVGCGAAVQVDLSRMGYQCNYVSAKHATIFYDQYSRVYELINYSEHGTIVDNIVYALDSAAHKTDLSKSKAAKFANCTKMSADQEKAAAAGGCYCNTSVGEIAHQVDHGCETSAVLHHGSFIRFGCLQFAFSVIDYQENDEEEIEVKTEKAK